MSYAALKRFTMKPAVIAAVAAVLLAVVYLPIMTGPAEFIGDDETLVASNPVVRQPSLLNALRDIWAKPMWSGDYIPLTVTTAAIEYHLWGLHPKMYRLFNLLLFYLIGIISYSLALRLNHKHESDSSFSMKTAAFLSVILLLLHPVNVESVSLIVHLKELLHVLFGLLSVRAYIMGAGTLAGGTSTILFLVAAQLSKGTAVVLPLIFAAYELFARKNWQDSRRRLPLLLFSAGTAGIIFLYQYSAFLNTGLVMENSPITLTSRAAGVLLTAHYMIIHLLSPVNLCYDYDIAFPGSFAVKDWILPALSGTGIGWLFYKKDWHRVFLVILALVPLLPYLNIVPLQGHVRGRLTLFDHYLLFTTVAAAPLLTSLLLSVQRRWRSYAVIMVSGMMIFYAVNSHYFAGFWKTRETLFTRTLAVTPNLYRAYWALGKAHFDNGRYDDAIAVLEKGISLAHGVPGASTYQLLADSNAFLGRYSEAERYYKLYLSREPYDVRSVQNLSLALVMQKKNKEAQAMVRMWLVLAPGDRYALETLSSLDKKKPR